MFYVNVKIVTAIFFLLVTENAVRNSVSATVPTTCTTNNFNVLIGAL
jgi:hypothetical protein